MDNTSYQYRLSLIFFPVLEVLEPGQKGPQAVVHFGVNLYCHDLARAMSEGISWDLDKNAVSTDENAVVPRSEKHLYNRSATYNILREFPDRPAEQSSWIANTWTEVSSEDDAYAAEVLSNFRPHDAMDETYIERISCKDMMQGTHGEHLFTFEKQRSDDDGSFVCWDKEYMATAPDMNWIFRSNCNATSPTMDTSRGRR